MVLKRKLPTQESKTNKSVETEVQQDDTFDMSIETDVKESTKPKKSHDLNDDFPDQIEDKPEDFIPAELKALEADMPVMEETLKQSKEDNKVEKTPEEKQEEVALQNKQENEDIAPVSFDNDDAFSMEITDEPTNHFEQSDAAPAELPTSQELPEEPIAEVVFDEQPAAEEQTIETPIEDATPVFEETTATQEVPVEFENQEYVNWEEVEKSKNDDHKDENFDSFENITWDNAEQTTLVEEKQEDLMIDFNENKLEDDFLSNDNGGIVPEIPGLEDEFSKPASVMGQDSTELNLNPDAKRKLVVTGVIALLLVGAMVVYSNLDTTTEVTNRWSGALTDANQDIAETKEEEQELLDEGVDVTKAEDVVDFSEISMDEEMSELEAETTSEAETEINLLEPEVIEKTASGKELIKATGEEELPKDVEEGANLITNITEELEKQKAAKLGLELEESDESVNDITEEGSAADINKKVDAQLAEYRKLLAAEKDPGKKIKPGKFFSGQFKEENMDSHPTSKNVSKVILGSSEEASSMSNIPSNYVATSRQVEGHKIVEYPKGVARQKDEGIRTLDHFRNLIVEKEDKRVRMPKNLHPTLRNQGFPKFKVISIVPNYGLIGEYSGKKGILMIGDSFQGWELVGVYESYADFRKKSRKHIISLK